MSSSATIGAAPTVTVTVAVSQFVGFTISQIRYTKVYVPAAVPGATLTPPVAGLMVTFGSVVLTWVITTVANVAGAPFSVSLTNTLGTATPPVAPFATMPLSLTASITTLVTGVVTVLAQRPAAGHVGSPPPLTVALLVTLGIAATVGVTGITKLVLTPAARLATVQVTVWLTAEQFAGKVPMVKPAGSTSVMTLDAVVAAVPLFVSVSV